MLVGLLELAEDVDDTTELTSLWSAWLTYTCMALLPPHVSYGQPAQFMLQSPVSTVAKLLKNVAESAQ